MANHQVQLDYLSDTLCVWAYVSQIRLEEVKFNFSRQVTIDCHFVTLFGNTAQRIGKGWEDRGGYQGFGDHVLSICEGFPHVQVNSGIWRECIPKSSAPSHLFIKALQILESRGDLPEPVRQQSDQLSLVEELVWRIRLAFFKDARDIACLSVLMSIAEELDLPRGPIESLLESGAAFAGLCSDMALKDKYKLDGSPTYLLNQGRQKLYGNVGYKIIEANINELLEVREDRASWC